MLNLVFQLLKLFSEGGMSATTLQILCAAAVDDGWGADDVIAQKLAGLGSRGKQPQNALRDLTRMITREGLMAPEAYLVKVPGPKQSERTLSVCPPHEYLHKIVEEHGLEPYVCTNQLWSADIGVGKLLREWGDRIGVDSRRAVGIGLHADGVSYSATQRVGTNRSAAVGAWNCISVLSSWLKHGTANCVA